MVDRRSVIRNMGILAVFGSSGCLSAVSEKEIHGKVTVSSSSSLGWGISLQPDGPVRQNSDNLVEYKIVEESNPLQTSKYISDGSGDEIASGSVPLRQIAWALGLNKAVPDNFENPEVRDDRLGDEDYASKLEKYLDDTDAWIEVAGDVERISTQISENIYNREMMNIINQIQDEIESEDHIISPYRGVIEELNRMGAFEEYKNTLQLFTKFVNEVQLIEDRLIEIAEGAEEFRKPSSTRSSISTGYVSEQWGSVGVEDGIELFQTVEEKQTGEINWLYVGRYYFPDIKSQKVRDGNQMNLPEDFVYPDPTSDDVAGGLMYDIEALLGPLMQLEGQFNSINQVASELALSVRDYSLPGSTKMATVFGLLGSLSKLAATAINGYYTPLSEVYRLFAWVHLDASYTASAIEKPFWEQDA
jgi:hypothetical protein